MASRILSIAELDSDVTSYYTVPEVRGRELAQYTVRRLAKLAGVSVRTLHHYDQIGLLRPSTRTAAGYRLYGEDDLARLQQVLFFKELDFRLADIQKILDSPSFDRAQALEEHRRLLERRVLRLTRLLNTVDKTLQNLKEDDMPLTDAELYEGFSQKHIKEITREVQERYDPAIVAEADQRTRSMSKEQWTAVGVEGEDVAKGLSELMDRPPDDPDVQTLIARHYVWITNFYDPSLEMYRGLSQMYVDDARFTEFYDKHKPGLAVFMRDAMAEYAERLENA